MGGSSLQLDREARGGKTIFKVPVRTLAGLVSEAGFHHVDAIKIDVEGFEDKVLIPYISSVQCSVYPNSVILEANVGSWQADLIGVLKNAGYQTSGELAHNGIFVLA